MNFAGIFLLKVAESPGCVRGLVRLHLSYCTLRTMFWLKELNFYFNQFCRGVIGTSLDPEKDGLAKCNGMYSTKPKSRSEDVSTYYEPKLSGRSGLNFGVK